MRLALLVALVLASGPAVALAPLDAPAADGACPGGTAGALRCLAMVYYCTYVLVAHDNGIDECLMALD